MKKTISKFLNNIHYWQNWWDNIYKKLTGRQVLEAACIASLWAILLRFEFRLHHILAGWPWLSCWISLHFNSLICEIIIVVPDSFRCCKDYMLSPVKNLQKHLAYRKSSVLLLWLFIRILNRSLWPSNFFPMNLSYRNICIDTQRIVWLKISWQHFYNG